MTVTTVTVPEIGMAGPDMVVLRVRDQQVYKGPYIAASPSPDPGGYGIAGDGSFLPVQRTDPNTGTSEYCIAVGKENGVLATRLKFFDRILNTTSTGWLDRAAADNPANYATIGGRTVTAVYRKSRPYDQGECYTLADGRFQHVTMQHEIFLKLSGALAPGGPYTVSITGNTFPATAFTYDDKTTRAFGCKVSQVGYRLNETHRIALFALWIPGQGTKGWYDPIGANGLTAVDLIDQNGASVYSGTLTLAYNPTDTVDTSTHPDQMYVDTATAPKTASALDRTVTPVKITSTAHGYTTGQIKYLSGFAKAGDGSLMINSQQTGDQTFVKITVVDANNFTCQILSGVSWVDMDGASMPSWVSGVYQTGQDGKIYDAFTANYWNTYVYKWDFSAYPALYPGTYRWRVVGLGVSDPFLIDDSTAIANAKLHLQGLYNCMSGMALQSSVGGWDRDACFNTTANCFRSKMPAIFADEYTLLAPYQFTSDLCAKSPFVTATAIPNFIFVRDAGDWDTHMMINTIIAYYLAEYVYLPLPSIRTLTIGWPKASTLSSIFNGTDGEGDIFHAIAHFLYAYYANQQGDGRVYGGVNFTNVGGGFDFEPAQHSTHTMGIMEADPASTFCYAALAASFGRMCKTLGYTTLGNLWIASGQAAYTWADNLSQDYWTNGPTGSVVVAYFETLLNFKVNALANGWSAGTYTSALALLFGASDATSNTSYTWLYRYFALGALYRATGDRASYGSKIHAYGTALNIAGGVDNGVWEFINTSDAASAYASDVSDFTGVLLNTDANGGDIFTKIRAILLTGSAASAGTRLNPMHDLVAEKSGVNGLGVCATAGVGVRTLSNHLIRDRQAMGWPSVVRGITAYYNGFNSTQAIGGGIFNFQIDASICYTAEHTTGLYESTFGTKKRVEPVHLAYPLAEACWDNTDVVNCMEWVSEGPILYCLTSAAWKHAYDGNTRATAATPLLKRRLTVS